jgi:CRISPR-associated protein (TIGR02710 family)
MCPENQISRKVIEVTTRENEANDLKQHKEKLELLVKDWLEKPIPCDSGSSLEDYYWEKLFPLACEVFLQKEKTKINELGVNAIVMTVGFSPEPQILTILACKPKRVFFLYTSKTEKYLDVIVEMTKLKPSLYEKYEVQETDPLDIYKIVIEVWQKWSGQMKLAADITGGTKSMTGGLAMVAALLSLPIIYVSGDFIPQRRRPRPGTEKMELLPNPYQVFGTIKEKEAAELFRRMDYQGASKLYCELANNVPSSEKFEILFALSEAYYRWDVLDFETARESLSETVRLMKKYRLGANWQDLSELLSRQADRLKHLFALMPDKPGDATLELLKDLDAVQSLLFTIWPGSIRRANLGMWDGASLLLYRMIEIMGQRRLARYGLDTADPDYSVIPEEKLENCLGLFNEIRGSLKMDQTTALPNPISLMDGYILLQALEDDYSLEHVEKIGSKIHWGKFVNEIKKRNYSILAHGFVFVSEDQYEEFKKTGLQLLKLFCLVEEIDFEASSEEYAFLSSDLLDCQL